jgi:cyclohexa-1,5-dienecarbonyl-CoA hydratase
MAVFPATPYVRGEIHQAGWVRLAINQPPGNVLSMAVCDALGGAIATACSYPDVKLVSIEGTGAHFSDGESPAEQQPPRAREVLPAFHRLITGLLTAPCATAAIIRGHCLGGGLEIALACDLVFAAADASMGAPEIAQGVFPPAAAALLPLRIGASRASRVVLGGDALPASWWESAGLVTRTAGAADLDVVVQQWFDTAMAPRSVVAVRHAAQAARAVLRTQALGAIRELERQYLDDLMRSSDAARSPFLV